MRVSDLCKFIEARERHRIARLEGRSAPKAGRADPIITKYRFCNVRRNDDRVTKWVLANVLEPFKDHDELWFALVVARLFNNEPTLASLLAQNCVIPFKPLVMRKILKARAEAGQKNFNAAYIVSTNGRAMNKIDYVIDLMLTPMYKRKKFISGAVQRTGQLANLHIVLMEQQGLGSFMAAQVLADLKYAYPTKWTDFTTFAASGPGSRRGLNRVLNRPANESCSESNFRAILEQLRDKVNIKLKMESLTAQDLQNCLCEFDKYERARLGEEPPKQLYKPADLPWVTEETK